MVDEKSNSVHNEERAPRLVPSSRFTLALLVFFAFIVQYSQRVNLPIAIVCMVNRTKVPAIDRVGLNGSTALVKGFAFDEASNNLPAVTSTTQPKPLAIEKSGIFEEKQFYWSEFQQQLLLGGYWGGYIFTQVPGGWLATSIGAKWVYATSLGTSSIATLAMTVMYMLPDTHFPTIFILRVLIGLAHGVLFPATVALWSVWAVPQERSTLASIGFCGTHLGTSFTMLIGGLLCRYFNAGWMYLFVISSLLGFVWFILWFFFTADSPVKHKRISEEEKNYILTHTGSTGKKRPMSLGSIPWNKIVKSRPLIALIITHNTNLFGLFFFLTNLGKILNELMRMPPQYTGYILASGFLLTLLSSLSSGIITDHLVRSKKMTLTTARRVFNSLTSFIPVICMASLCFCDENHQLLGVITVLIFLAGSGLGYGSGYIVNFADIVPAYSGIIFGIANTIAALAGLIGNIVAGILVKKPILEQWRTLYIMFGIVYFIGGLIYAIYGSAEPRKWAKFQAAAAVQEVKADPEETMPMTVQT